MMGVESSDIKMLCSHFAKSDLINRVIYDVGKADKNTEI